VQASAAEERRRSSRISGTDVTSLSSMLAARWKSGAVAESSKPQQIQSGQIRKFRITKLDPAAKKIEVELI